MKKLNTYLLGRFIITLALTCTLTVPTLGGVAVLKAGASPILLESQMKYDDQAVTSPKSKIYNDTDQAWTYKGHWSTDRVHRALKDQIHTSHEVGDYATISIEGSRFTLVYSKDSSYGKLDIYVDGLKKQTITQNKGKPAYQQEWTSPELGSGTHLLKFVHATGKHVNIDAIKVREPNSNPSPAQTSISNIVETPTLAPSQPPSLATSPSPTGVPTLAINPSPTNTIPVEDPTLPAPVEATSSPAPSLVPSPTASPTPTITPASPIDPAPTNTLTSTINPTPTNTLTSTINPTPTNTLTSTITPTATSSSMSSTGLKAYYVSSAGNNTDGKSWNTAWKGLDQVNWSTIQPGDTIYISGGTTSATYSGGIKISKSGTASGYITIDTGANSPSPAGNNGTVIIEGGDYCIRTTGSYLTIRNLLCQHATNSGFRIEGTGTVLENNTVRETYGQGIHVHYCAGCIVRGNRVTTFPNDGASENRPYQTDGIVIYDSSDTLIERNWIKLTNQYGSAHIDGIQASTTLGKNYKNITIQYNYVENTKNMTSNSQGIYLTQMEGNVKIIGNVVNHPNGNQTVVSYLPNNVGSPVNVFVVGNTIKCAGYRCLLVGDDNPTIKNNIIWQTGSNQLVDLRDNTSCNPANINNNLYYAPNSSYPFAGNCGRTWSDWNNSKKLDANGIFGQNPNLDSCFRPSSATSLSVGKGAILADEYSQGLSSTLCGTNGPTAFLPVTLSNRGSSWDIGAYEMK